VSELEPTAIKVERIPASIVRAVAQLPPQDGDFRQIFPEKQPHVAAHLVSKLEAHGEVATEISERVAAALWEIYERALNDDLPLVSTETLEGIRPAAGELISHFVKQKGGLEQFDAEWLIDLPRGPQPNVMGFVIGALRATRLRLTGEQILAAAVVLVTISGAFEAAAYRQRQGETEEDRAGEN